MVADNFKDLVQDENKDVLIEFYAPWCGHCKKLVPIYDELAKKLESVPTLTIAKMDATENDVPPGLGFTIEGFPTIKLFKAGTNEVVDYDGREWGHGMAWFGSYLCRAPRAHHNHLGTRDVSGFIKFLTKNVEHKFEVPEGAVEEPAEEEEEKEDAEATGEEGAEHDEL